MIRHKLTVLRVICMFSAPMFLFPLGIERVKAEKSKSLRTLDYKSANLVSYNSLFQKSIPVSGVVKDEHGQVMAGVKVSVLNGNQEVATNSQGEYSF